MSNFCAFQITLLLFAKARELVDERETEIEVLQTISSVQMLDHILVLFPR